ncbi:MAG: proline--tRNA ligase, partial [Clostridia bacterium]|nr:proline--tRNA ligase [Clostridia bacterium]
LRSREFLWQEGHTAHATAEEAIAETERMLNVYADFCENCLAIPVIKGRKTESDKFAGAEATYAIEALMHDGVCLQAGTSHYFGDGFARAFNIQYADKNNTLQYVYQTSWGVTTRLIGAIIMVHGDNSGLVLPPKIAPIQAVIIPVAMHKPGVLDKAKEIFAELEKAGIRVKLDDSDNSPGWKYSEYEMKGVPLRIEIGPRDIENRVVVVARRDNGEKSTLAIDNLASSVSALFDDIMTGLYNKAKKRRDEMTYVAHNTEELKEITSSKNGFIKMMWCGDEACEKAVKDTYGVGSRCIPLNQENHGDVCPICGRPAKHMVVWGKAY